MSDKWQMTTVCTDGAANVVPIWIQIVRRLNNRSECCWNDDGTRFGNAVKQICCQKISFACANTCVHGCIYVYVRGCVRLDVCASVGLRAYERGRICANIAGILKYPRNI